MNANKEATAAEPDQRNEHYRERVREFNERVREILTELREGKR